MTALVGTGRLLRLAARRDRLLAPVWLLAVGVLTAGILGGITSVYATAEERLAAAAFTAASVPTRAFSGPASGIEVGAMAMVESFLILAVLVALMSAQMVVRHTRRDEEAGRAELLGSAVVGRQAPLVAALLLALATSLGAGMVVAGVLVANDLAVAGSIAAGAAVTGVGAVFAGVAAVTAQVFATGRASSAGASAVLGAAFLLRAVGDAGGEIAPSQVELVSAWPSWLSPLGWGQQLRPFHQDNWEVLGLFVVLVVVLVAAACRLTTHRDVGSGMVAVRAGPATAGVTLGRPLGLAWRQHRTVLLGWVLGLAIVGAAFGGLGEGAEEVVGVSEQLEQVITQLAPEGGMTELFIAFTMSFLGVAAAGYTVQALLRLRSEESEGRVEPVLAAAVSRTGWLAAHVTIAVGGTVLLLTVTGVAGAIAHGIVTADWHGAAGVVGAAWAQIPAALALGGVVVAAFALVPRWSTAIGWGALAAAFVMGQLGAVLDLPQPVLNASPFTHVPAVPAQALTWTPLLWLLAAAAAFGGAGMVAFRRRDLVITA